MHDTGGSVVVQMLIFSMAVFGMAGLVTTVGRIYVINTSAQAYVDQIALAAAAELDNKSDSIERARRAAFGETGGAIDPDDPNAVLKKQTPFGVGVEDLIEVEELRFLSVLPRDQGYQYEVRDLPALFTTVPEDANYVVVVARPISIFSTLLPITDWGFGVEGLLTTRAVAVATLVDGGICDNPMFMFCNPNEGTGPFSEISGGVRGRMMLGKAHNGGSEDWVAGNFGLLDQPADIADECKDNTGAQAIECKLATNSLLRTCSNAGADLRTGQVIGAQGGLNLRFGIYAGVEKYRDNDNFSPDVNVIKGWGYDEDPPNNKTCTDKDFVKSTDSPPYTDSVPLPRHTCLPDGCTPHRVSPAITDAELAAYWNQNHPGYDWTAAKGNALATYSDPYLGGQMALDTRYNVYRYEIAENLLTGVGTGSILEAGDPKDATTICTSAPAEVDRRVFIVASINCNDPNGDGDTSDRVKGNSDGVPVDEYFFVFLTEPVVNNGYSDPTCTYDDGKNNNKGCGGKKNDDDIYVEFIRQITSDQDRILLHEYVELNR